MVGPTETTAPVVARKIIVVKLPFDLQERMLAFPFLHVLSERYPNAELHFITPKLQIEVLNLLPFKAYYHEFDEDEIETIFDVHRFAITAKIYTVDLYISLTNQFADALLGVALKAKQRLGFSDGWKTFFFNQKTSRPVGHHICEDFFSLLKVNLGGEINTTIKVASRDLPPVIEQSDTQPYVAINLSPIRNEEIEQEWVDLISQFENQRFVFFGGDDQIKVNQQMGLFMTKLPRETGNSYMNYLLRDPIEIAKMMAHSRGVVTYNGPMASVSAYTGAKTLILCDREDPQRYGPFYFLGESVQMGPEDVSTEGVLKGRKIFNMGVVADRIHGFFNL
ncbi:MAG TPA: hypothetical protein VNJ08_02280 [Bacteriovoracaceae bacterium]|nr:hypothetical protein [Bacteriovoracaceae bacterium]